MDTKKKMFKRLRYYVGVKLWDSLAEAILKEDYCRFFIYMDRQNRIPAYYSIFELLPDDKKYELFLYAYIMPEIGLVKPKIIDKIFELKPHELAENLKGKADDEGYITIYRGESEKSTRIQRAISWTLDRNIAVWFAKRFNFSGIGYLYTAKAGINKVIAYLTGREEEEILIRYKDIEIINKEEILILYQG